MWQIWKIENYKLYLPLLIFPILAFATTYLSQAISMRTAKKKKKDGDEKEAPNPMSGMMKFMPFTTLIFGFMVPAGLALYWAIGNILSILQTYLIRSVFSKKKEGSVKNA